MKNLKRPLLAVRYVLRRVTQSGLRPAQPITMKDVGRPLYAADSVAPPTHGLFRMPTRIISPSVALKLPVSKGEKANRTVVEPSKLHIRTMVEKQSLRELTINIFSQNVRGLQRDEYVEEATRWMARSKAFVACWQETWKLGDTIEETNSITVLNHGPKEKLCKRGSLGVAIALGPEARQAWELASDYRYAPPHHQQRRATAGDILGECLFAHRSSA
jgi:hypothetical protein